MTRSEFYQNLYSIEDVFGEACGEAGKTVDPTIAIEAAREAASSLRDLGSECEDKRSNMPDSLQDSDTGQLLETRASECEDKACELEGYADDAESAWENREEDQADEEEADKKGEQEICDEVIEMIQGNIDFSIE